MCPLQIVLLDQPTFLITKFLMFLLIYAKLGVH